MNGPEQLAQKGIFSLEEAILDVLFEAKQSGNPLVRLTDIRKELGTHSKWRNDNWVVRSLLYKLEEDKRVWQNRKGGAWQLTDAEHNKRIAGSITNLENVRKEHLVDYGLERMSYGDYEGAIIAFDEALKHYSKSPMAYQGRALCKFHLLVGISAEEYQEHMGKIVSDLEQVLEITRDLLTSPQSS